MATINVNDLTGYHITGVDLFKDSESFIQDLFEFEDELNLLGGHYQDTVYYPGRGGSRLQYA